MSFEDREALIKEQIIDTPDGCLYMEVLFTAFKDLTHYDILLKNQEEATKLKQVRDKETKQLRWQTKKEHEVTKQQYDTRLSTALMEKRVTKKWIIENNDMCKLCCWLADIDREQILKCIQDTEYASEMYTKIDTYFRGLRRGVQVEDLYPDT